MKENKEKYSLLEISITNNTGANQFIDLFKPSLQDVSTEYPNLTFSDPISYNILIQELHTQPIEAKKILFASQSQSQLSNPILIKSKDADGNESEYNKIPSIFIDTLQNQGARVKLDFDELILDTYNYFYQYRMNPGETISIVLTYRKLRRWCIDKFPKLFNKNKSTIKLKEEICKREDEFRKEDKDFECKNNKKSFQVTLTNNTNNKKFIDLFNNFDINRQEQFNEPSNQETENVNANYSKLKFAPYLDHAYTFGGVSEFEITRYDKNADFVVERNDFITASDFSISQTQGKLYFGEGNNIREYLLGSGVKSDPYTQSTIVDYITTDDTNSFVFTILKATSSIFRTPYNDMNTTTEFVLGDQPSDFIHYFASANRVMSKSLKNIIALNPITGADSIVYTDPSSLNVKDAISLESGGIFCFVYNDGLGGDDNIKFLDSDFNVLGTYTANSGTSIDGLAVDEVRGEIISTEQGVDNRTIIFNSDSIENNIFNEEISGYKGSNLGFINDRGALLIGEDSTQPVTAIERSSGIQILDLSGYEFFTESLGEDPIKVSCMDVITENQSQLVNNFVIQDKDANGYIYQYPKVPIIRVDTFQDQGNRAFLKFIDENLIFDGNTTFAGYPIDANETVTLVLYYHQFKRVDMLTGNSKRLELKKIKPVIDHGLLDKKYNKIKHDCAKGCEKIEIQVTNTTGSDTTFSFFTNNETNLIVNQPSREFGSVGDYNYLTQQIRNNPYLVCGIEVIGADQDQLTEPMNVDTTDADGNSFTYQHFPVNFVHTFQKSEKRIFIPTTHLILDGNTTVPNYVIKANSSITFVLFYRQYKRSDFLDKHVFPILKTSINGGDGQGEQIEYYNDITDDANNKKTKTQENNTDKCEKNSLNKKKSIIFGSEQVYSNFTVNKNGDLIDKFINRSTKKYANKSVCKIPKSLKQNIFIETPDDISFGDGFQMMDLSHAIDDINSEITIKTIGYRDYTENTT